MSRSELRHFTQGYLTRTRVQTYAFWCPSLYTFSKMWEWALERRKSEQKKNRSQLTFIHLALHKYLSFKSIPQVEIIGLSSDWNGSPTVNKQDPQKQKKEASCSQGQENWAEESRCDKQNKPKDHSERKAAKPHWLSVQGRCRFTNVRVGGLRVNAIVFLYSHAPQIFSYFFLQIHFQCYSCYKAV